MDPIVLEIEQVRVLRHAGEIELRRDLRPQPTLEPDHYKFNSKTLMWTPQSSAGAGYLDSVWQPVSCPLGVEGCEYWVKEDYALKFRSNEEPNLIPVWYRADYRMITNWLPAYHMPQEYSRFDIRVTEVKIEKRRGKWMFIVMATKIREGVQYVPGSSDEETEQPAKEI